MDTLTIIGILAAIVGIIAGIVQVLDYLQKRREKPDEPSEEDQPPSPLPTPQIPHNLPPRSEFIGRETEKARVHEALLSRPYLVSIDGIGGIGKTVLALEVAHECLRASRGEGPMDGIAAFDGFIWTTAKDRDLTLNSLLDAIARTLDYPGIARQPVEEKQIAVRKLLQEKPYLVIVDNFETITDASVRNFLRELPEPSKALITTREKKLLEARMFSLEDLKEAEALALVRSEGERLGLVAVEQAEDQMLLRLYQAAGGAPLAIKWAVGQIRQRGQSLDTVLVSLHGAKASIFDHIFARSWDLLSDDARQVLMVMPIFATSASRAGIEAASDVQNSMLDEALGQLVEMSLVDATDELDLARRRYGVHPLTRFFAAAKLEQEMQIQHAARQRLAGYFQALTREHGGFWHHEGFARLEPELPNILVVIQWCLAQQIIYPALDILNNIITFMFLHGYWNDLLNLGRQAVEQATGLGDELSAARFKLRAIAWVHRHWDNLDLAEKHATRALTVFERAGQEQDIALAKRELGRIARERGDLDRAEQLLEEVLAFSQSDKDKRLKHLVTANLADVALRRGDLDTAWSLSYDALISARQFDDSERVSHLLNVLGDVARQRGDFQQSKEFWMEALSRMKWANCLDGIADALLGLARVDIESGSKETAGQLLLDALEIYQRLDMQFRIREVETLLAELPQPTGREG